MLKKYIYLDYAATTPMDKKVEAAMRPYYQRVFGNPSSVHWFGQEASAAVFRARQIIAGAIGADYKKIIFTGSATEANNLALRGAVAVALQNHSQRASSGALGFSSQRIDPLSIGYQADALPRYSSRQTPTALLKIVVSAIEHESVIETARDLEKQGLAEVVYIPVNRAGIIDIKKLEAALNERTVLVSIQYANSQIGVIQPIAEIAKIIQEFNSRTSDILGTSDVPKIVFHTDAVQAFQYLSCTIDNLGVDLMTLSAHKIYGPKGIGALYVRGLSAKSYQLKALITGGGQEQGIRSGTENVSAAVGFGAAVALTEKMRVKEAKRVGALRDYLWHGLKKIVPDAEINSSSEVRLPNILNAYFPGRPAQDVCIEFDLQGVAVSPGSACSSRAAQPSYVIAALGFESGDRPGSSIRFSLGRPTTKDEIARVLTIFKHRFKK